MFTRRSSVDMNVSLEKMKIPTWMRSKLFRWVCVIAALLVLYGSSLSAVNQWCARRIVQKAGLPSLPPNACIVYSHIYGHNLLFEEVALGFTAPKDQMEEWIKATNDWGQSDRHSAAGVLNYSVRKWDVIYGVDFSASLSYK